MNRDDFIKLIGVEHGDRDYLPVACLLRTGYGVAGYYNATLNVGLIETVVLINARMVEFHNGRTRSRPGIEDFNDFLEEIVVRAYEARTGGSHASAETASQRADEYGRSIPLTAVAMDDVAVVYPVAHIERMMRIAQENNIETRNANLIPAFLDFDNKSIIMKILRTKLW